MMLMSVAFFSWQARTAVATCALNSFFFMRSARFASSSFLPGCWVVIETFFVDVIRDAVWHQPLQCSSSVQCRADLRSRYVLVGFRQHVQRSARQDKGSRHLLLTK